MEFPFVWDENQSEGEDNPLFLNDLQRKFILRILVIVSCDTEVFIGNYEDIDKDVFESFVDDIINRVAT